MKKAIDYRLREFEAVWERRDREAILKELLFCLLTPQSKARVCWGAIEDMACTNVLLKGRYEDVLGAIGNVRFKYKKSNYLIAARERFSGEGALDISDHISSFPDPISARNWFADNIKGMGYKEAGHFLRNIGLGQDIAILDRHILRNLSRYAVIDSIPTSIGPKRYLDIESRMKAFSNALGIPMDHLDILLWYKETGDIFK